MQTIDFGKSFYKLKTQIMEEAFNPRNYTISRSEIGNVAYLEKKGKVLFLIPDNHLEDMVKILAAARAGAEMFPKAFKNKKTKTL